MVIVHNGNDFRGVNLDILQFVSIAGVNAEQTLILVVHAQYISIAVLTFQTGDTFSTALDFIGIANQG